MNGIWGPVDALIYLNSYNFKLAFVHLLKLKSQVWASDILIRSLIFFIIDSYEKGL